MDSSGSKTYPRDSEQQELCRRLQMAIYGDIPFEQLPNHGIGSTESSEAEARDRLNAHMRSELANFIDEL